LISSHFESSDLDQTFVVYALRNGTLEPVFDNRETPDGHTGYGYLTSGVLGDEIRFTTDCDTYNHGDPADPTALSPSLRWDWLCPAPTTWVRVVVKSDSA
jgi:hypothetical protein